MPHHLLRRHRDPLEEVLAEEQGAVEALPGQTHRAYSTTIVLVSSVGPGPSPPDGSSVMATNV